MAKQVGNATREAFSLSNPWNPLAMPGIATNVIGSAIKEAPSTLADFVNGLISGGKQ
jgi:hypothetical protein